MDLALNCGFLRKKNQNKEQPFSLNKALNYLSKTGSSPLAMDAADKFVKLKLSDTGITTWTMGFSVFRQDWARFR